MAIEPLTPRRIAVMALAMSACALSGCLFDSGVEWSGGPYELLWIDVADNVGVFYKLADGGSIGRIDSTVFAVGWDGRYLVAKQHPHADKAITNFYIIDSSRDSKMQDPTAVVVGPLREDEYQQRARDLKLPRFTKVLDSIQ